MLLYNKLKKSKDFTSAEKAVVDYILQNPKEAINLSVDELANATFSSPSCIVRLSKKLGMKGYSEFKIKLATELNALLIDEKRIEINMPFSQNTKEEDIPKLFLKLYYQTVNDVYNSMDTSKLKRIVNLIYHSDDVQMYGVGPSLLVVQDFLSKCEKLRLPMNANNIIGFENIHRKKTSKNPLAIIVSNSGTSHRVKDWIFENYRLNIPIILITANESNPLNKLCKEVLLVDQGEENIMKQGSFASRLALTFVLDNIYMMLFMKDYEDNINYIYEFKNNVVKERENRLKEYYHDK